MTTTLATLGLVLTASAAPEAHPARPAHVSIDGLAGDWDADASSITITDPDVHGGPRAARRALRALDEIDLVVGPRTRIVTEDEDGVRERIDADTLFADLEASTDDLEVEASVLVSRAGAAGGSAGPVVSAKRIVVQLPSPDPAASDPADATDDPAAPDGSVDPAPVEDPAPASPELPGRRGRR